MYTKCIRIFLGLIFTFSGFVKAIDPIGTAYKIEEYLASFNMDGLSDLSVGLSVLMCALELYVGIMLLMNLWRKMISIFTFAFMTGFTCIVLYLIINPESAITECGCFGDAIQLPKRVTVIKNIILFSLSLIYINECLSLNLLQSRRWYYRSKGTCINSESEYTPNAVSYVKSLFVQGSVYFAYFLFCLFIPIHSLLYLPQFDFLPFNIGVNILKDMTIPETADLGEVTTLLIYENKNTGLRKKFELEDEEWQDSTKWEYINTETVTLRKPNFVPKIKSFAAIDKYGNNVTKAMLEQSGYTFLVVARDIKTLTDDDYSKLRKIYNLHKKGNINVVFLTTSPLIVAQDHIKMGLGGLVSIFNMDDVTLKSLIRSDKGVVLIRKAIIEAKWNFTSNAFTQVNDITEIRAISKWENISGYIYWIMMGIVFIILLIVTHIYSRIYTKGNKKVL